MNDDKVRRIADEALERLAQDLEAGKSDVLREYLAAQARFHKYSWNNVLLIHSQRPTATHVAGYHAWHELGRYVMKGEKAIAIAAPIVAKTRDTDTAKPTKELTGFRTAYVFDVAQTQGRPLPEFARTTGDPAVFAERLRALIAERGIALSYDPSIAPAQGLSSGGQIRVLPGLSRAEEFAVVTHELAHEMLHHGPHRPESRTLLETQAEAVAFVVSRGVGLETHSASADYIHLYDGNKKTLEASLAAVHQTSTYILRELLMEEREHKVAERSPVIAVESRENESSTPETPARLRHDNEQDRSLVLDR